MDGVTILSSETVGSGGVFCLVVGIIVIIVAIAALVMGIYMCCESGFCNRSSIYGVLVIFGALLLGLLGGSFIDYSTDDSGYEKLKVIVDDSVSYNAFTSRYEVIDQDGDIWIVKERKE